MKLNQLQKTLLLIIIMILIIIIPTCSSAFSPDQITGEKDITVDTDFTNTITDFISKVGAFISVGVMMVIGIKYITGSLEEKAAYKKSMVPYVIGCFLLFGASLLAPKIKDTVENIGKNEEEIGNSILGIIQVIGTLISVGVIMILGIKYMAGSLEERAAYKKSMIPYAVGVILLFGAVNLTNIVYDLTTGVSRGSGIDDATSYLNSKTSGYGDKSKEEKEKIKKEITEERDRAREERTEAYKENPDSEETKYWQDYTWEINEWLKFS